MEYKVHHKQHSSVARNEEQRQQTYGIDAECNLLVEIGLKEKGSEREGNQEEKILIHAVGNKGSGRHQKQNQQEQQNQNRR